MTRNVIYYIIRSIILNDDLYVISRRAIAIMEDTFNELLLILFLYFGIVFACYGFLLMNVSTHGNLSLSIIAYDFKICISTFMYY